MHDGFAFTPAVELATQPLWNRVKDQITPLEWRVQAPLIAAINALKREKNAVILAHNYMTPDIFHGVGDYVGDSLGLAREAARSDADIIVQAGVHFMAETSKVLAPQKTVLIPDLGAGCSLASSITADDVRLIKQRYPGLPVVTYVNTTAEVKAETDVCCTSANAVQVVEHVARLWGVDRVILIPDEYLARNVARQTAVGIIAWQGRCEVHERFTAADIEELRAAYPDAQILAHPECPPEVLEAVDFAGSTTAMSDYVLSKKPRQAVLITECSMADNVACDAPDTQFVRPCNLCPHMKRISLQNIYDALLHDRYEVTVDLAVADRARAAVQRMIDLPPPAIPARYDLVKARHHVDVELIEVMDQRIQVVVADITALKLDAIVNAANATLLGGGGVDGAIHRKAGPKLYEFCEKLGGCKTGDAKISPGFDLPARFVIHTVGPVWSGGNNNEDKVLSACYRRSLEVALDNAVRTLAFPAISTGAYRFPPGQAAEIAVRAVSDFLDRRDGIDLVQFCCFSQAAADLVCARLGALAAAP